MGMLRTGSIAILLIAVTALGDATTPLSPSTLPPANPALAIYSGYLAPLVRKAEAIARAPMLAITLDTLQNRDQDVNSVIVPCLRKSFTVDFVVDSVARSDMGSVIHGHLNWKSDVYLSKADADRIADISKKADVQIAALKASAPNHQVTVTNSTKHNNPATQPAQNVNQGISNQIRAIDAKRLADVAAIKLAAAALIPFQFVIIKTTNPGVSSWQSGQQHSVKGNAGEETVRYFTTSTVDPRSPGVRITRPTEVGLGAVGLPPDVYVSTAVSFSGE